MIELHGNVDVSASPARVWESLAEIGDWPQWWSAAEVDSPPVETAEGQRFRIALRPHKMKHSIRLTIVEVVPRRSMTLSGKKLGMAISLKWQITGRDGGCLIKETFALGGPGMFLFRLMGQVEAMGYMIRRNLNGLKNLIESQEG